MISCLILFLLVISSSYKCSDIECENQCQTCQDGYLLECMNRNSSSFKEIKDSYNYEVVKFTGNQLFKLDKVIFSRNNNVLSSLTLSNNKINQISYSKVFSNLPNLRLLDLSNNRLSFKQLNELKAFEKISNTLTIFKLNNAWNYEKSAVSFIDSVSIDRQLHSLLDKSNMKMIKTLEIDSNSLVIFNLLTHDHDDHFNKELYGSYQDILCILPNLERLSLKFNLIEEINFDSKCLNQNLKLKILELQSNKINTVDSYLVGLFRTIKSHSFNFTIFLENNPFRCDCSLYPFYLFLKEDVVDDYDRLYCTHEDSFHSTRGKKIIESKLHHFCSESPLLDENDIQDDNFDEDKDYVFRTTKKSYIFSPRNRNNKVDVNSTTALNPMSRHHSAHKLLYFIISCIFIAITLMIIFSVHCKKCCQNLIKFSKKQRHSVSNRLPRSHRNYDRFADSTFTINTIENNFDGTLRVDLDQTSINDSDLFEYSLPKTNKKPIFLKRIFTRKNKDSNMADIESNEPINNDSNDNEILTKNEKNKINNKTKSLTSAILNRNDSKKVSEKKSSKNNDSPPNRLNLEDDLEDYDYDEETIIDSASILPRTKIVEANANSIIYRTP